MKSLKELYRIGHGPSSSHTMAPNKAATRFVAQNLSAHEFVVTLYGALAATGHGHLTDKAVEEALGAKLKEIVWKPEEFLPQHPNAMKFEAYSNSGELINSQTYFSVGGGAISTTGKSEDTEDVYPFKNMQEVLNWCKSNGRNMWELVYEFEGEEIEDYLQLVWETMQDCIKRGLNEEGQLPGILKLQRKAHTYFERGRSFSKSMKRNANLFAYSLAVSEENASGHIVVAAPTCGACGVLPAVCYFMKTSYEMNDKKIIRALATAGLIGNIVKQNASISGAEVGCQGEVGVACAMASGAATQLQGGTPLQIEYAAEMGLEHHLGLTCDPIRGLVQIPCIERNAFASLRSLSHATYSLISDGQHHISFDKVVTAMRQTGHDLPMLYKETALGGLAKFFDEEH
ncbi:MAG: L-serine ammonia-lyase [Bacteroidales bacterium]